MSWGLRAQLRELQDEKKWLVNVLQTITELRRGPTKSDLQKILKVLEGNSGNRNDVQNPVG